VYSIDKNTAILVAESLHALKGNSQRNNVLKTGRNIRSKKMFAFNLPFGMYFKHCVSMNEKKRSFTAYEYVK